MRTGPLTTLLPWSYSSSLPDWGPVALLIIFGPFLTLCGWWALEYARSPLRRYPGPFLAGWTNLWRFRLVLTGNYYLRVKQLHDKYGPVVRIGPNLLDLDYPELIKTIYSADTAWRKTEFYHNNSVMINGEIVYNIFSQTDPAKHARMQRPIAKYLALGNILTLEPLMDKSLNELCDQLERRFVDSSKKPQTCDLGQWIAYCAWDVITWITFSRPYGYMEKGFDFDGTIGGLDKTIDYFSAVGQMPFLDFLLDKNPIVRIGPPNLAGVAQVALGSLGARQQGQDKNFDPNVPDLMQNYIDARTAHPDIVDDNTLLAYMMTPLLAGADTTAISIRAVFYFLLRNPAAYRKLQDEILAAGFSPDKAVPYKAARALPYLEAVINEGIRLHPSVCMPLERYVPAEGLKLPDGSFVPPGTAVGINPYITGRNRRVWGEDADDFRPERWLRMDGEDEMVYQNRLRGMRAADFAFGSGARMCTGRHLALLEIYKMVATLVRRFDIEPADGVKEWTVMGSWFARQTGVLCNLKRRSV